MIFAITYIGIVWALLEMGSDDNPWNPHETKEERETREKCKYLS